MNTTLTAATPQGLGRGAQTSLADLIDLHIADMRAINKSIGPTKYDMLTMLKNDAIGCVRFSDLDRLAIINFARRRARRGAVTVTVRMYIGAIKLVLISAAALQGLATMPDQVDVARATLQYDSRPFVTRSVRAARSLTIEERQQLTLVRARKTDFAAGRTEAWEPAQLSRYWTHQRQFTRIENERPDEPT
jgi:hypothetical protein